MRLVETARTLSDGLRGRAGWTRSAVTVRLIAAIAGVAVLLLPGHRYLAIELLTVLGVLVAVTSPDRGGAGLAVGAGIWGWYAGYGAHGMPPVAPTLALAVALYLLHTSTALAAQVPLTARLLPAAARHWARRCGGQLAVAAGVIAASYALTGLALSPSAEVLGLLGVLLVVGVAVWLFSAEISDRAD